MSQRYGIDHKPKRKKNNIYYKTPTKEFYRLKLLSEPTIEETLLWNRLKSSQLGITFTRQKVILGYIVDFYCFKYKLAIEVDGSLHDKEKDSIRDKRLNSVGIFVLRFTNEQVRTEMETVLTKIKTEINKSRKFYEIRKTKER